MESILEDDQRMAKYIREKVLYENWWGKLGYIIDFSGPIYDMIRFCDTSEPCLHLVYLLFYD